MTHDQMIAAARRVASSYQLDPRLVCAIVEQESSWNPWAMRFEDAFYMHYVKPLALPSLTESMSRSISWGLMQVMGQTAREHGFKAPFLSSLCDPEAGLDIGCRILKAKFVSHPSTTEAALLAYNGGGNKEYPIKVLARLDHYTV